MGMRSSHSPESLGNRPHPPLTTLTSQIRTDKDDYWLWRRLSESLSPFWCGLSGALGCVTWELILDGYSESSYSGPLPDLQPSGCRGSNQQQSTLR